MPVGSHEQHGPHLPFDTDTRIAVAVTGGAVRAAREPVWVGPVLAVASSAEHDGFPGTVSLSEDTTVDVLVQVACSLVANAPGCLGVVFANAHGGNARSLSRALDVLGGRGIPVRAWSPRAATGDAHAGHTETSVMLHLDPGSVRLDLAEAGNTAPLADLSERLRVGGVRAVSANGVLGDPAGASAAEGVLILADWVTSLAATLDDCHRSWAGQGAR